MSILPFCANKRIKTPSLLFQFLPTHPSFSGSSLSGDDGKLGQTVEENRIGTRHPRHGTALGTWRAVTHLRRLCTSFYACLQSEIFAVSVALPAIFHARLMILVLCNLTVTVQNLSNARLFFSEDKITVTALLLPVAFILFFLQKTVEN